MIAPKPWRPWKAQAIVAHRSGQLEEARYAYLRAAEELFALAGVTRSRHLRDARLAEGRQMAAAAKKIVVAAPAVARKPLERRPAAAPAARKTAESEDDRPRFEPAERPSTKFKDLAGLDAVKEEVKLKLIYPLRHAAEAKTFRVRTGGGILLYGPPGTGKTLVARAIAGEIDAAFFTVKPSDIMSKWVGEAEQNVAALFRTARAEPLAVLFIDEIEALVPRRRDSQSVVMQRVVTQILSELEGFDSDGKNPLLFLGATNEPWSIDPAALRPGRFDEKIYVGLPDAAARRRMLELYLARRPTSGLDLHGLAARLDGYSGADIRSVCDRAAAEAFLASIEGGRGAVIDEAVFGRAVALVRPSVSASELARFARYQEDGPRSR